MNHTDTPREDVLAAIKAGRVKMRSRSYFLFWGAIFALSVLTLAVIFLYFIALALVAVDVASLWFATSFGQTGIAAFIWSVPWIVLLVIAVAILVIQTLVRRYPIVYQLPLVISLIGILFFGILGGLFIRVVESAFVDRPIIDPFVHRGLLESGSIVLRGKVASVTERGFVMQTSGVLVPVVMDTNTRIEFGLSISTGDNVLVFGTKTSEYIQALGVKKVE